jgi:hypothetical protein
MPMCDDDGGNVHRDDDHERDVPVEGARQELVVDLVSVVERIEEMDRPVREPGRVADERQQQLGIDEHIFKVVRQ